MSDEKRLHPVDVAVLRHLESGVDYPTLIAHRGEIEPVDVERRCERLAERDLVEPVSHEVVYRITDAGLRTLEGTQRSPVEERERSSIQQAGRQ